MDTQTLLATLGITDASDLETVERTVTEHIKRRIQSIADQYDETAVQAEVTAIREIYAAFFDFSLDWARKEIKKTKGTKPLPDSLELKRNASQVLQDLQNNIVAFALCYMHLNRFMTLVRDEIKENNIKAVGVVAEKSIKWTSDTGIVLGKQKKRKRIIDDFLARFDRAQSVFDEGEHALARFRSSALSGLNKADAERVETSLRAALRTGDFARADKLLTTLSGPMKTEAARLISLYRDNADYLAGEDGKLFLSLSEMTMIRNSMEQELRKIRGYLVKYNLPYMEYKLDALVRYKDKLLVIGSLDGLMTLYRRLIGGMARPLTTHDEMRIFSGEVLERINYLLAHQFSEVPKIEAEAIRVVDEFRQARLEYESNLKTLLQEAAFAEQAV